MQLSFDKIADLHMKHLELIQAIVTRMANYSATLKNYCLTLTTAVAGYAIAAKAPSILSLGFLPIVVFALIDSQYLRLERRFRGLYNHVRSEDWSVMPTFEINMVKAPAVSFASALFSWSIGIFYVPLAVGLGVAVLLSR
jgi:hypothetical protein